MGQRPFPSYWLYKDNRGEWRWTYEASNGLTIAVSSESYKRRIDANRGIQIMQASGGSPVWMPTEVANDD
jgi:uncharacterized protein YegP (UPF0339 family)